MKANGTGSGFMIFSGSVLPNLSGSDNYRGIGLELHDGDDSFLQYRTETGIILVQYLRFKPKTLCLDNLVQVELISGSDGNLEISSSNLHISGGNISITNTH